MASDLLQKVNSKMDWTRKWGLLSFAYPLVSSFNNTFSIIILVAPKGYQYNDFDELVIGNLSYVVKSLYHVLKDGRLQLPLQDGYHVSTFTECDGLPCAPENNTQLILPPLKEILSCSVKEEPAGPLFAENVCYLYTSHLAKFSTVGKRWLNQLKTCFQTSMTPILLDFMNQSCSEIRNATFDVHPLCCFNTYIVDSSICNLDRREWWQIFWTVIGASDNASVCMIRELISTASSCSNLTSGSNTIKLIKFEISSSNTVTESLMNSAAKGVLAALSQEAKWSKDVSAISFTSKLDQKLRKRSSSSNDMGFTVDVLIALRAEYDLNTGNAVTNFNLTGAVKGVLKAIQSRKFKIDLQNGLIVSKVLSCTDTACSSVDQQIDVSTSDAVIRQRSFFLVRMAITCHLIMVNHYF